MSVRVSVAMAVYQGEKYLEKQLDSIICQLGNEDELVVSYDQSADRTLEIINKYAIKDGRIRVVIDQGSGINDNFNNALKHCQDSSSSSLTRTTFGFLKKLSVWWVL